MSAKQPCASCGEIVKHMYCSVCASVEFDSGIENVRIDDVIDLAAAIRAGNMHAAMDSLERVAREIEGWSDLIAPGRYSALALAA